MNWLRYFFLPYQAAWLIDGARLKVCEKSRQVGMSFADSYDSVRKAAVAGGRVFVLDRQLAKGTANPSNPFDRGRIPGAERVLVVSSGGPISTLIGTVLGEVVESRHQGYKLGDPLPAHLSADAASWNMRFERLYRAFDELYPGAGDFKAARTCACACSRVRPTP